MGSLVEIRSAPAAHDPDPDPEIVGARVEPHGLWRTVAETAVMGRVRIVWGTGTGSTALASYDAALAAAGVHEYNLVRVSSVLPADTTVDVVGTAPDLGPVGGTLTVVEARETAPVAAFERSDGGGDDTTRDDTARDGIDCDGTACDDADYDDTVCDGPARSKPDATIACVGLGWAQVEDGRGIVYEATGTDPEVVRRRIDDGLRAGCTLRDFEPARSDRVVLATDGTTTRVDGSTGPTESTPVRAHGSVTARDPDDDRRGANGRVDAAYVTGVVLAAYGESEPIL